MTRKCEHIIKNDDDWPTYVSEYRDKFTCPEHRHELTYKDYLSREQSRHLDKLAPLTARPKHSRGDNPGYRFKIKTSRKSKRTKPIKTIDGHNKEHIYVVGKTKIHKVREIKDE